MCVHTRHDTWDRRGNVCPLVKHIRTSLLRSDILLSFYERETSYSLSLVKWSYGVGKVMVTRQGRAPESPVEDVPESAAVTAGCL